MADLKPTEKAAEQGPTFTKEELEEMRKNRISFMKEQIESLEVESNYSKLRADISENTYREHLYKVKLAQLKAPPPEEKTSEEQPEKKKS